jgi:MOSC domain-containing protein YiiM
MSPDAQLGEVRAVLTGRATEFARGRRSGIAKAPRDGRVAVDATGLDGDEQGDTRFHGGRDKAVHAYAFEHYPDWIRELGALPVLGAAGAFGENLSTTGITEAGLCLADRLRIGTAVFEVSQARQPCWKLNERFGVPDMARRVQDTGRAGWYLRVLEPGTVGAGDGILLLGRPHPSWSLQRLMDLLYGAPPGPAMLREAIALPLVPSWRSLLERRLATGRIEDWSSRLQGPA